jgi:hypothetical protein
MSSVNGHHGNVVAFEALKRDLESLLERVATLTDAEELAERSLDQVNEVVAVVQKTQRAVATASDCLHELPAVVVRVGKKRKEGEVALSRNAVQSGDGSKSQKKGSNARIEKDARKEKDLNKERPKRGRVVEESRQIVEDVPLNGRASQRLKRKSTKAAEMEDEEEENDGDDQNEDADADDDEDEHGEDDPKNPRVQLKAIMKAKKPETKLRDGMIGMVRQPNDDDSVCLVYFSLGNEDGGLFECPSLTRLMDEEEVDEDDAIVSVKRSAIVPLRYSDLTTREQEWYQQQVEQDMLKRFEVNFPVLFANQGCDMIGIKLDLLNDPSQTEDLIERLAQKVSAVQAMAKSSPKLSAANNAALMLASVLHKNLSESGDRSWYKRYQGLVEDMCERCDLMQCDLAPSTVERYRKAGELMLKSDVVACLLPSYVWVVEDAVEGILDDEARAGRLEDAFKGKLNAYLKELSGSGVLQLVGGNHKRVLELAGEGGPSPLELQAQNLLLESGSGGLDDDGSVSLGAVESVKRQKIVTAKGKRGHK